MVLFLKNYRMFNFHKFFKCFKLHQSLHFYSTKEATKTTIKYTNSLNLPKTAFPSRLSYEKRREIERNLIDKCHSNLYSYQRNRDTALEFVLHDGPPYANGNLHMGHAVNKILKDITSRYHVVNGSKVHYRPGWDCHGLPIELKAMNGRTGVNALEIRNKSQEFASNTISKQKDEFKSWGIMADWNNEENIYKTNNLNYVENQLKFFSVLYEKGLIYRDLKPVYWSPSSRTALAEAELEYDSNFTSPSIVLRLELQKIPEKIKLQNENITNFYALIWTTTPWTLPSNQAICFNKNLNYSWIKLTNDNNLYLIATSLIQEFENLVGKSVIQVSEFKGDNLNNMSYIHPIDKQLVLPFLESNHVQDNKGTGLVHTSPAHGPDDFLVSLTHKLPIKCYVNEDGKYTDLAPAFLKGKFVLDEGNETVISYLQNDLIYQGQITHSYPIDWRTKKPVIILASNQWFIDTENLKQKSIEEICKIQIYPKVQSEINRKMLVTQLQKRPYWCISRQRSWGVPIPVFYEKTSEKIIINDKIIDHICAILKKEGNMNFWWSKPVEELIPESLLNELNLQASDVIKGKDIFDIWFDSGISWYNALDNKKIADLYLEGYDQFSGWFQSSLLTSVAYRNCAPYKSIFVNGFTVDEKGRKMSKSLGNIISPTDIIKTYGTDVLSFVFENAPEIIKIKKQKINFKKLNTLVSRIKRWWVASHGTQHSSIIVSENLLKNSLDCVTRVRSILRFLIGIINQQKSTKIVEQNLMNLDKYFLNELWEFDEKIQELYKSYDYNRVTLYLQNFLSNQISSTYFHLIKDRLYCGHDSEFKTIQTILFHTYKILCKSLWPIIPFLVEENWSYYATEPFYKTEITKSDSWKNSEVNQIMEVAFSLRHMMNQSFNNINTWTLSVQIKCNNDKLDLLTKLHPQIDDLIENSELCEILQVSSIKILPENIQDFKIEVLATSDKLCPRCRRFSLKHEIVCNRCENVLLNKL